MAGEAPSVLTLDEVPTLRTVYEDGQFLSKNPTETPKFPGSPRTMDVVSIIKWDITRLKIDAIVNAANRRLLGGGGVDGAIHHAAGSDLLDECRTLGGAETGEAKITLGYRLPATHVIHTVGPVYDRYEDDEAAHLLRSAYRNSLQLAVDHELRSIAFCSISTGVYGYPLHPATHIALRTTREFLDSANGSAFDRVVFVTFSDEDTSAYLELAPLYFPFTEEVPEEEAKGAQEPDTSDTAEPETVEKKDAEVQTPIAAVSLEAERSKAPADTEDTVESQDGTRRDHGVQTAASIQPAATEPNVQSAPEQPGEGQMDAKQASSEEPVSEVKKTD